MNILKKLFTLLGVLLLIYSILGRFIGSTSLGLGIISISVPSGILLANSFLLLSILIKSASK
ncbi:MAG: hypothetical protein D4S01_10945 [Dehalococcoidia bacterium]|nr:MAG: hypothetical protein D4S01_10945 [Dehalococcoidia bacterium]